MFSVEKASLAQKLLSKLVKVVPIDLSKVNTVSGVDVSYKGNIGCAVATAYSLRSKTLLLYSYHCDTVNVPYIPGFLAFREAPLMIKALIGLMNKVSVDIVLVNGHGIAHPRKCGIASHIGVVLDIPSIGVARKLLYGNVVKVNEKEAIIVDSTIVGYVLSKENSKLYVSIGHKVTAEEASQLVLNLWHPGTTLPEPLRLADELSRKIVRKLTANP
jgi:deoxyribonuclease V